jgi:ribonuclease G
MAIASLNKFTVPLKTNQSNPSQGLLMPKLKYRFRAFFENFGVNKEIKVLFGKKVPLQSGGYLIIEHTEAMHVVDVNSGNRKGADGQETNALLTNVEAAEEIARVLQLRDMGGIVCVDFIDLHDKENNKIHGVHNCRTNIHAHLTNIFTDTSH